MQQYSTLQQTAAEKRFRIWFEFLRDLEMTAAPAHTVVRFPGPSTYIFSTGQNTFWMADPCYNILEDTPEEQSKIAALVRGKINFIIITHLHGDHCQQSFINEIKNSSVRWIISEQLAEEFSRANNISPEYMIPVAEGATVKISDISITAFPGYHNEPGRNTVPSASYLITLPDNVRIFMPADVRDPDAAIPYSGRVDYTFGHVFPGRDNACGNSFPLMKSFAEFLLRTHPSAIILAHLYEISRMPEDMWTLRHALMYKDIIKEIQPETEVFIPYHGSYLPITPAPAPYSDIYLEWNTAKRQDFADHCGISIKKEQDKWFEQVIAEKIPVVELSWNLLAEASPDTVIRQVEQWRKSGGKCLSMHLPDIPLPGTADTEQEHFKKFVTMAVRLGCDRVTIHVPSVTLSSMKDNTAMAEWYAELLSPLINAGIAVGIENTHMKPGYPADDNRPFGFTPVECLDFVRKLRSITGSELWGVHIDAGHAYSNHPFSEQYDLRAWLTICSTYINGMHLHQFEQAVTPEKPYLAGHRHITGRTTGYPDLAPLFEAWDRNVLRVPVILEIYKGPESEPFTSRKRLLNTETFPQDQISSSILG